MGTDDDFLLTVNRSQQKFKRTNFYPILRGAIDQDDIIQRGIAELYTKGCKLVVADFPGNLITEHIQKALSYLDFCVIPFSGSDEDISTAYATVAFIEGIRSLKEPPFEIKLKCIRLVQVKREAQDNVYSNKNVEKLRETNFEEWREKMQKQLKFKSFLPWKLYDNAFANTEHFKKKANLSTMVPLNTKEFNKIHPYTLFEEILDDMDAVFTNRHQEPKEIINTDNSNN